MGSEFIQGTLTFANLMLSIFVLVYAASFIQKSESHQHRRPWVSLFFASTVFFLLESVKALHFLEFINLGNAIFYLDSVFIAVVLFTFIFQHKMLIEQGIILIHRRGNKTTIRKQKETATEIHHIVTIKKNVK
ncbi:MAG: hypothetical protein KC535_05565 [Nanoarchaeota archaeon]|nr:hypothetical protein [Nanoarchaeota archaeon]